MWIKQFTIELKNGMYGKILDYSFEIRIIENIPYFILEQNRDWYNLQLNWLLFKREVLTTLYNFIYKSNL